MPPIRRLYLAAVIVCAACLLASTRAAESPPLEVEAAQAVTYATSAGVELKLDWVRPKGQGPFPGVLCILGGGWAGGKREDCRFLLERLARAGYVAMSPSYRLAPAHRFPAQVEDVKCAVRWMRAHAAQLGLDPARIGALGLSAGGHLACMLGAAGPADGLEGAAGSSGETSAVQAVVNVCGPTDLTTGRWSDAAQRILTDFLGGTRESLPEAYRRASPVTYLGRGDAPVLTFQGTADPLVPFEQAEILHRRLAELGVENRLAAMEGKGHGWGGADLEWTVRELVGFFDRHLKGRRIARF